MSQETSDTCKIRVLEKDYVINCSSSEREKLMKSAEFLNQRIKETRSSGSLNGGEKIMVMTALNIVYDFLLAEGENESKKEIENDVRENDENTTKKLQKLNKKVEKALFEYQQIELT